MGSYCMEFEEWFNENKGLIEQDFIEQHSDAVLDFGRRVFSNDPNFYLD